MIFYACDIPEDLTYDIERDVWIRFDGDFATLGMTDVAQTRCGKFAAVSFRSVGKKVEQGKALATIESAKWVGPFPAPFSCEIIQTNESGFARDIWSTRWRIRWMWPITTSCRAAGWEAYLAGVLEDARSTFTIVERAYERGGATILDLLDAARTSRTIQQNFIEALFSYQRNLFQLESSVGQEITS